MKSKLTKKGYIIDKAEHSDIINEIKRELSVKPFIPGNFGRLAKHEYTKYYSENETKICIPRFYGKDKLGEPEHNQLAEIEYPTYKMKYRGKLRPNQTLIVDKIFKGFNDYGGGILVAGCGSGKTNMAIYIACKLKLKTLFVVHKDFLKNQAIARIKAFTNQKKVGTIQSKTVDTKPAFVIGMIQSLSKIDYDKSIFDDFGLIIIDEVHHMGAKVFSGFYKKISAKYMLGISAENSRNDRLYKVINWYMGPILHFEDQKPNEMVIVKKYLFKTNNKKRIAVLYNKYIGELDRPTMITNLLYIKYRNRFIINLISALHSDGKNILFLTGRLDHVDVIYNLLEDNEYTSGHTGKYIGGMKQVDLDKSACCQIIVGTYDMAQEGLDIPNLNVVIMGTPKGTIKQSVGRILRKEVYEEHPLIIDIVDDNTYFIGLSGKRDKYYASKKYNIQLYGVADHNDDDNPLWDDMEFIYSSLRNNVVKSTKATPYQELDYDDVEFLDD